MGKCLNLTIATWALLVCGGMVHAQFDEVEYVEAAFDFGILANYDYLPPSSSTLAWSSGEEATVYTSGGWSIDFSMVDIDVIFGGMTDYSSGEQAEALFTTVTSGTVSGKWTLTLSGSYEEDEESPYYGLDLAISLQGGLLVSGSPWAGYYEKEDGPETSASHLLGKAWMTVDPPVITVNGVEYTALKWDDNDISGIIASTTLPQTPTDYVNIDDYQADWNSENVLLEIWTDESYVVPEPATLGLLGLGGVVLFWRRKRA